MFIPAVHHFQIDQKNRLRALRWGNGERVVIAIHGYSRTAETFSPLGQNLPPDVTLYAVDLPFHGPERWQGESFTPNDLMEAVHQILDREQTDNYYLIGFSLGARVCWNLIQRVRVLPVRLLALAPDGLNTRVLSRVSGAPRWLNRVVNKLVENPERMRERLLRWERRGLPVQFIRGFVEYGIQNPRMRHLFYGVGRSLPDLRVRKGKLKRFLQRTGLEVRFLFGSHDPVIPSTAADFLRDLPNVSIKIVEANHRLVTHGRATLIWRELLLND